MSKLFVFGIGGTGVRVLKSLILMLAAGVKIKATEVVPIIIDVDRGGGDLTRTVDLLKNYSKVQEAINQVRTLGKDSISSETKAYDGFFGCRITDIYDIPGREFRLNLTDVQDRKFSDYIDSMSLNEKNSKLAEMLFSEENLNLQMNIGFKGKPNLGSVVLNQFVTNPDFIEFASRFDKGDRIFIISSIHGGTGSSGFPLLVKNIRNASNFEPPLPNGQTLKEALLGGITVQPYFKLQSGEIKSEDFISKTVAALEYYKENLNQSLDALYYIGLNDTKIYENHPGGPEQENAAHFVELASALSVIHFAEQDEKFFKGGENKFFEFGTKDFPEGFLEFPHLGDLTRKQTFAPLSRYYYFNLYLREQLQNSVNRQPWSNRGPVKSRLDKSFLSSDVYKSITTINKGFQQWLRELYDNSPAFRPFNLDLENKQDLACINRMHQKSRGNWKDNFALFDDSLNKYEREFSNRSLTQPQKFIGIFNEACNRVLTSKYQE